MATVPTLHFNTDGLAPDHAFAAWRELMAPIMRVERIDGTVAPRGNLSCTVLGDVLASRMVFTPQRMIRDRRQAATTPDHLTFMLYMSGGLSGDIAGSAVVQQRNRIMSADMGRELDARGTRSSAIGLTVPRHLLADLDLARIPTFLDPERNRLLVARLQALWRRLPTTGEEEAGAVADELAAFLRRLFDPSRAADVLEGLELDTGLVALAGRMIDLHLASPDLSPAWLAERLNVSRATLYRAYAREGGIMHCVWERRLDAIRDCLADPFETRSLERLSADCGFKTPAHLSHAFRARFGITPREWRRTEANRVAVCLEETPARAHDWYGSLGRR